MFGQLKKDLKAVLTKSQRSDEGFSLIELLVVVLIIGILAAIAIPIFLGQQDQAKDAAAKSDLGNAKIALVSYATDHSGTYTTTPADIKNYGYAKSDGVSEVVISTSGNTFCITATSATGTAYKVTESTGVVAGTCP